MAFLTHTKANRRAWIPLALMALTGAGCMLFSGDKHELPLAFPHRAHVGVLQCADCHPGAADSDEPGMPSPQQCALCHNDLDANKPPEKHAATLFEGTTLKATRAVRLSGELIFSHQKHAGAESNCGACHTGIETSERIGAEMHSSMRRCMDCHAERTVANDCATCHREIRQDVKPEDHFHNWQLTHGKVVRAATGGRAMMEASTTNCALCHSESTCVSCHMDVPPPSHNNFWRLHGHGVAAQMDRQNCAACHKPDSCERCHENMEPQSHTGMFGAPKDTHCLSCHFPLKSNSCAVCHKNTQSHTMATPMPSWHNPGMNCRQCHGVTQSLPHVDNGSTCTMCHK